MSISAINFRSAPVEMERMTTVSTPAVDLTLDDDNDDDGGSYQTERCQ